MGKGWLFGLFWQNILIVFNAALSPIPLVLIKHSSICFLETVVNIKKKKKVFFSAQDSTTNRNLVFSNLGRKALSQCMYTWGLESLGVQTFQPKANSNLWFLVLKAGLPWSWTYGLWRKRGTFVNLFCVLCLARKVCLSRSSRIWIRTPGAEDRWVFNNHRQTSQLNCCCGLASGVLNLLLALVWDLVDVTHVGR